MKIHTTAVPIHYFGKLPSQGDFVKSNKNPQLISILDRWAGSGVELLSHDTHWKVIYDAAPAMHFAFLNSRNNVAVAGHLIPSHDASDRRFPFMAAVRLESSRPLSFIARGAMTLSRLWAVTERQSQPVIQNEEPSEALRSMAETTVEVAADVTAYDAAYDDFLDIETTGSLRKMLEQAGHGVSVRGILLALGDLMGPVMASGSTRLQKGLTFPLPMSGSQQSLVATFWSELLAGFLGRGDFELVLLVDAGETPLLTIGFNGSHDRALHSILDPRMRDEYNIVLDDPGWVADLPTQDHALKKLASYLDHDNLSLRTARDTFRETFLGG